MIAWTFDSLNDSHTFFVPPPRPYDVENGWRLGFVGDDCFVTAVKPGSDAEAKGLKPGDRVLTIEGFRPTRETIWKLDYAFNILAPRAATHFQLVKPGSQQPQQLEIKADVKQLQQKLFDDPNDVWGVVRKLENLEREADPRYVEVGDIFILKLPDFELTDDKANVLLGKIKKHNTLILDLRSNPGGYVDTLKILLGGLSDHEVKIAPRVKLIRGLESHQ